MKLATKLSDIVSGGDLLGELREALRDVLTTDIVVCLHYASKDDDALNALAAKLAQRVSLMPVQFEPIVVGMPVDDAAPPPTCKACSMPAHADELDEHGRCRDCHQLAVQGGYSDKPATPIRHIAVRRAEREERFYTDAELDTMQQVGRDEVGRRTSIGLTEFDHLIKQARMAIRLLETIRAVPERDALRDIARDAAIGSYVVRNFIGKCERLNRNIFTVDYEIPSENLRDRIAQVDKLIAAYFEMPDNSQGGPLHVVIADSNWGDETIERCIAAAAAQHDRAGEALGRLLRSLSHAERMMLAAVCDCGCTPERTAKVPTP